MQAWFGMPYLHYWDEPQTASTALNIIKSGDLNPHFFRYGSLLIYACVLADFVYYFFAHDLSLSSNLHLDSISDVVTNADTNWPWTISHRNFSRWLSPSGVRRLSCRSPGWCLRLVG